MHIPTRLTCLALLTTASLLQGCAIPAIMLGTTAATVGVNTAGSNVPVKTQMSDSALRLKVINALNSVPDLADTSNIEVTTFDGIVLLLGQVPNATVNQQVANATANVNGVQLVYNQLTIGPRVNFTTYTHDSWITTVVKSNMVGHVNPLHFKVITENSVVYLLAVTTQEEGAKAADIASRTKGVTRVVKAYSYILPNDNNTADNTKNNNSSSNATEPAPTAAQNAQVSTQAL